MHRPKPLTLLTAALLGAALVACQNLEPQDTRADVPVTVLQDAEALNAQVQSDQEALNLESVDGGVRVQGQNTIYRFNQIAQVLPPSVNGIELRATHVTSSANKVYVSYAREGDVFAGGLDVLNVSDPAAPKLELRALFNDTDVYASAVMGDRVFLSGARDPDISGLERPSVLLELIGSSAKQTALPGWAGMGLAHSNGLLFTASGNLDCVGSGNGMGGSSVLSSSLASLRFDAHCNAQSVAASGSKVVTLESGATGKLRVYDVQDGNVTSSSVSIGAVTTQGGRNTVVLQDNLAFVAMGKAGVKAFNVADHTSSAVYDLEPEVNTDPDLVANGIAFDGSLVYIAHGSGGLRVARLSDSETGDPKLDLLGKLALSGGSSANYVAVSNDLIFVASGRGGLTVARREKQETKTTWTQGISPVLECVSVNRDGTFTAHFGYSNQNGYPVQIPVGKDNYFAGSVQDRGQPTAFDLGRTAYYPNAKFRVRFNANERLVWNLTGRTSTAFPGSKRCQ
jgi:hypothetical protein